MSEGSELLPVEQVALLPCPNPWCNSTTAPVPVALKRDGWRIACACGVATHRKATEAEAVAAWNTRLTATTPAEKLAEAAELLRRLVAMSRGIAIDLRTAHSARGAGASSEMRSDDRDQRNDFSALTADADRFLAVYKEQSRG